MTEELFCKLFPEYTVNGKPLSPYFDLFERGYEEAENRAEELKKENEELKSSFADCDTCKRTCDMGNCCDPRTMNNYLLDKVKVITKRQKLLKENAELKKELEEADNATDCFNKQEEIIAKAKDHIKKLLDCLQQDTNDPQTNYYVIKYMTEAEQFLNSEVGKVK